MKRVSVEGLIVAAFVMLAAIYSVATPVFEASDEWHHFPVVKHIADGRGLPVQAPGVKTAWEQEGSQPPLYYLLVAPMARWIDTSDMVERLRYNPHAQPGDPNQYANKNLIVHSDAERFPWRGTTLAVHLIRFLSIVMGAATVVLTGTLTRHIVPDRPDLARGAMAVVAFNPMFLFVSASVNNDNLVILLSTLALVLAIRCLNEPRGDRRWLIRRLALGVAVGLAALTKVSGLLLLLPIALALSVTHLRRREIRRWIGSGLIVAAGIVVLAGWWYARNAQLYGEWLGIDTMAQIAGLRNPMPTLAQLAAEFEGFKIAYWALFGAVDVLTTPPAYVFFDAFTLAACVGLAMWIVRVWRRGVRAPLWTWLALSLFVLALFVGVVRWTSMTPASQGRLLFPAIGAISAWLWLGWDTMWSRVTMARLRSLKWSVPIGMLLIAAQAPFADILPTYSAPRFIDRADVPADVQVLNVVFDGRIELIGVASSRQVDPHNRATFVLYWQCLTRMSENYSVFVSLKGRQLAEVGKLDAYPQRGLFATSDCPAGAVFADEYHIPIEADIERPVLLRAQIGLTDWVAQRPATLTDGAGHPISALLFDIVPLPSVADVSAPITRTDVTFGDVIRLDGYTLTEDSARNRLWLDLHWSTVRPPPEDYTVFVHLLDARETLIAQWDAQPLAGDYPTHWWQPGEHVLDSRTLPLSVDLASGQYDLAIGLYRAPDGPRLPARDFSNAPIPGDRVLIERAVLR